MYIIIHFKFKFNNKPLQTSYEKRFLAKIVRQPIIIIIIHITLEQGSPTSRSQSTGG